MTNVCVWEVTLHTRLCRTVMSWRTSGRRVVAAVRQKINWCKKKKKKKLRIKCSSRGQTQYHQRKAHPLLSSLHPRLREALRRPRHCVCHRQLGERWPDKLHPGEELCYQHHQQDGLHGQWPCIAQRYISTFWVSFFFYSFFFVCFSSADTLSSKVWGRRKRLSVARQGKINQT